MRRFLLLPLLVTMAYAAEPRAWIRFDDAKQEYRGTKYRFLGDAPLEVEFAVRPKPDLVLDLKWGAKNDEREAVLNANGTVVQLRHGGFDGFQWMRVVLPSLTGETVRVTLRPSAGKPAFLAALRVGDQIGRAHV